MTSYDRVTNSHLSWSKEEALTFIQNRCIPHPWRRSICISDRIRVHFPRIRRRLSQSIHRGMVSYWNRGIATQAMKPAVAQVYKDLNNLVRLQARVFVDKLGSLRVLEKAGFTEGVLRKHEVIKGEIRDLIVFLLIKQNPCLEA